uniref:ING domain-containing protein n=2 Tax=Caenorhabditis tropicalis TaxID=1561998 RepID=A0A1I7SYV8_9PELO
MIIRNYRMEQPLEEAIAEYIEHLKTCDDPAHREEIEEEIKAFKDTAHTIKRFQKDMLKTVRNLKKNIQQSWNALQAYEDTLKPKPRAGLEQVAHHNHAQGGNQAEDHVGGDNQGPRVKAAQRELEDGELEDEELEDGELDEEKENRAIGGAEQAAPFH